MADALPNQRKQALIQNACRSLFRAFDHAQVPASEIVQQLIEHRLALPFHAAVGVESRRTGDTAGHPRRTGDTAGQPRRTGDTANDSKPLSAQAPLIALAAKLQSKAQPMADVSALSAVLAALKKAGINALLLKGAAYAAAFYPEPNARRNTDHDILVAPKMRKNAHAILIAMGFRAATAQVFQSICGQANYRLHTSATVTPVEIDLHWELGNNFALYQCFDFAQLHASSVEVLIADIHVLRPNDLVCALHCALNYLSDHPQQRSYLALLDLMLIAHDFSAIQQRQLLALARTTKTLGALQFALLELKKVFGVDLLGGIGAGDDWISDIRNDALFTALESRFQGSEFWWPMTTPRAISAKLHFLYRQLLPPSDYMRARYAGSQSIVKLHFKRLLNAIQPLR